jgi:phage/plasmid-associated DNA primase
MTMPVFLQNVPHEFILTPVIKKKDSIWGIGKGWSLEEATAKLTDKRYISVCYYLKGTDIAVIDIDNDDTSPEDLAELCDVDSVFVKGNTKGYHVYVSFKEGQKPSQKNVINCFKSGVGDYLGEKVFERVGKEWNGDFTQDMDTKMLSKCFDMDKIVKPTRASNNLKKHAASDVKQLLQVIDLISVEYLDDRESWLKILMGCKKSGITEEQTRILSQKSISFTDDGFDTAWDSYDDAQISVGEGTLRFYAKKSDPAEYAKIATTNIDFTGETDAELAQTFQELQGDCCLFVDEVLYVYIENEWRIVDVKNPCVLRHFIRTTLLEQLSIVITTFKQKALETESKEADLRLSKLYFLKSMINSVGKINCITKMYMDMLVATSLNKEDVFDKHPYIFRFKNKAFDLKIGIEVEITKEHYITQSTNHDFVPPTREQLSKVDSLFNQIFPDPEVKDCYLSILFQALTGVRQERLFLANGGGRNGKGLLNELMFELMGNYAYKLPVELLTKELNTTGPNPQLANCDKKRLILASEPEDGTKIQMGVVKEMTGGNEISARGLYSSKTKVSMHQALVLECNKKPQLSGRIDTSVLERIVDIPFESTFTTNPEHVDEEHGIFPANTLYKTEEWRKEHTSALFIYIAHKAKKELYIPPRIRKISEQYVMGSDELYTWTMEGYVLTDDENDVVKMKDLYKEYTESSLFCNLSKAEKRMMTKKGFTDVLKNHIVFKKRYKEGLAKLNGQRFNCERLHKIKKLPDDGDSDVDEM